MRYSPCLRRSHNLNYSVHHRMNCAVQFTLRRSDELTPGEHSIRSIALQRKWSRVGGQMAEADVTTRQMIDKALGALMTLRGCSEQAAFDELVVALKAIGADPYGVGAASVAVIGGVDDSPHAAGWGHLVEVQRVPANGDYDPGGLTMAFRLPLLRDTDGVVGQAPSESPDADGSVLQYGVMTPNSSTVLIATADLVVATRALSWIHGGRLVQRTVTYGGWTGIDLIPECVAVTTSSSRRNSLQ